MAFDFDDRLTHEKADADAYKVGKQLMEKENETLAKTVRFIVSLFIPFITYES